MAASATYKKSSYQLNVSTFGIYVMVSTWLLF